MDTVDTAQMSAAQLMAKLMARMFFSSRTENRFEITTVSLAFNITKERARELMDEAAEQGWMHNGQYGKYDYGYYSITNSFVESFFTHE